MNFSQQSEAWLKQVANRKKHPVRESTFERYRSALDTHLIPALGSVDLKSVGNKAAKEFVAGLSTAGLSPASIQLNLSILKAVVGSATDENGDELYPVRWNGDFIDAPAIEGQNAPELPLQTLQRALRRAKGPRKAVYAFLAGSGLRIGEALELTIGPDDGVSNHWNSTTGTVFIRHAKTGAGIRLVDLDPALNEYMARELPGGGKLIPESVSTLSRELFRDAGFSDFHRFRRFRLSHLDKQNVPNGLKKFWAGHAAGDITERYVKMGSDIETRKLWAKNAGLGFEL